MLLKYYIYNRLEVCLIEEITKMKAIHKHGENIINFIL